MFSIAAILNKRQKGELYFGVKNDGTVIGQEINDESLRKVSQAIGNHIKPAIYPKIKIKNFTLFIFRQLSQYNKYEE